MMFVLSVRCRMLQAIEDVNTSLPDSYSRFGIAHTASIVSAVVEQDSTLTYVRIYAGLQPHPSNPRVCDDAD